MGFNSVPIKPLVEKSEKDEESKGDLQTDEKDKSCEPPNKPDFFTDKNGNLKFVNVVVRQPCLIFFVVLALCVGVTIALAHIVFKAGNPITDDSSTFDLYDKRSIAYDSLRLAKEELLRSREINAKTTIGNDAGEEEDNEEKLVRLQENTGDILYWLYEAKTDEGVFSKESLRQMRSSEIMFTNYKRYPKYCWLEYSELQNGTTISNCKKPLSVLNTYYASSWNSTLVQKVIADLTPENVNIYNSIAACVEYNMFCQFIPKSITSERVEWARNIHYMITKIMSKWDGEGDLNRNPNEVTLFLAHLNKIVTKSPYINFFFDANFTVDNPISMYTRSIIFWGSPLDGAEGNGNKVLKK